MQVARAYLLVTIIFSVNAIESREAIADDMGHWGTSSGKVWKSGFGGCWHTGALTSSQGVMGCGGAEAAPEAPEQTGYYWPDDQDYDGVIDANDRCPFTPEGIAVDSDGCANDNDGDGVPDYLDQCPETPLGNVVDTNGCSRALVKLQGVHFKFDSASLTSEARSILDRAMSAIRSNSSQNLAVEGHTDSTGSDSYNLDLSQRRAQSVVDYLVSKGANSSRLNAKGLGENSPVSANDSAASRAQNRRVEIFAR